MALRTQIKKLFENENIEIGASKTLTVPVGQLVIGAVPLTATATQLNAAVGSTTDLDLGSSGAAGSLDIFPATAANGKTIFTATNNGAARNLTVTNVAQTSGSGTLKFPDIAGGTGQLVATTSDYKVSVNANGGARAVSLSGDLTTGANLTFSGADAVTFTTNGANSYTLPAASGTIALATGAETGTTSSTFTVDSDSSNAKIGFDTNSATGNFTLKMVPANLTADRTITLGDAAGQVVLRDSTDTLTNKTLTAPQINGATAAVAVSNYDFSPSTGTFKTPSGVTTLYGNVANNGNITFDFSTSNGTFKTSTGINTFGGDVALAADKDFAMSGTGTFATGTGAISLNGDVTVAADKDINMSGTGTLTSGTGAVALNGDVTIAVDKDLNMSGTGTVATGTGTVSLNGDTTVAAGKTLAVGTAAGGVADALKVFSPTAANGSLIIEQPDNAGDFDLTLHADAALGQDTDLSFPDPGGVAGEVVVTNSAHQLIVNCNASDRTMSLTGTITVAADLTTTTGAITLAGNAGGSSVTLPASGTLSTLAGAETLTNKVLDADNNTITDLGSSAVKAGTEGLTATPVVAAVPFVLSFQTAEGAETLSYTVPAGKTLRVLDVRGYKITQAGGAAGTVTIKNAGSAITNAIDLNIADTTAFAAGTYDDAQRDVAAAAALQIVTATAAGAKLESVVNVLCMWV